MATKKDIFKTADIQQILAQLRDMSLKYRSYDDFLIHLVKVLDANKNGTIEFDEFVKGMSVLGFNLSYQEVYTLMRYFDKDRDFKLSMKEFYEGMGGAKS